MKILKIILIVLFLAGFSGIFANSCFEKEFDFPEKTTLSELSNQTNTAKYGISIEAVRANGRTIKYILVWDKKSGRSKMYYSKSVGNQIIAASSSYNLPSNPLGDDYHVKGEYKIDFLSRVIWREDGSANGSNEHTWTIVVWDSKNCFSKFYYGSNKSKGIHCKTTANESFIPLNPFKDLKAPRYDVQIKQDAEDMRYYAVVTDEKSGRCNRYTSYGFSGYKLYTLNNSPVKYGNIQDYFVDRKSETDLYRASFSMNRNKWYFISWNRKTGNSVMHYKPSRFKPAVESFNLPSSPLGEGYSVKGEYRMQLLTSGNSYYTSWLVLVWDTGNGKSQVYVGDSQIREISKFTKPNCSLPENPLGNIDANKIEMSIEYGRGEWHVIVWDEDTGKSKFYSAYFNEGENHFSDKLDEIGGVRLNKESESLPLAPLD